MSKEELGIEVHKLRRQNTRLKQSLSQQTTELTPEDNDDMLELFNNCQLEKCGFDSAATSMWTAQKQCIDRHLQSKNKSGMRWDPRVLRWALSLYNTSKPPFYNNVQQSAFARINWPCFTP
eukprot:SAG31_NODE_1644_length_7652_cov_2.702502_7_plen_121_part_00